jgi:ubiquinone/menaquinone biosynthesis C-methylase UbiE
MKSYQQIERKKRDRAAGTYDEWLIATKGFLFDIQEKELFARFVKEQGGYLAADLGSGTGRITEAIVPFVGKVVALDYSHQSLAMLQTKKIKNHFSVCANACLIPFTEKAFNLVVSCEMLGQMQLPELLCCLREVNRILTHGGLFAFSVYNFDYWRYKGVFEIGEEEGTYYKRFSVGYVRYLARQTNFEVKQIGYYKALPLRFLKHKWWLTVDRLICNMTCFRKKLSAYMMVVLEKR